VIDRRNEAVYRDTLFSRDDQVFHTLDAGINAGQHEGGGKSLEIRRFGFILDHGGVSGGLKVPVDNVQQNNGTQGHGQGYLGQLKSLTPELVQDVVDYQRDNITGNYIRNLSGTKRRRLQARRFRRAFAVRPLLELHLLLVALTSFVAQSFEFVSEARELLTEPHELLIEFHELLIVDGQERFYFADVSLDAHETFFVPLSFWWISLRSGVSGMVPSPQKLQPARNGEQELADLIYTSAASFIRSEK